GGSDNTARLWEVTTGKELRRFVGKGGLVKSVLFALDGKTLITGGYGSFRVWDTATGEEVPFPRGRRNGPLGYRVALAADGKTLASSSDNVIQVWDLARRQKLRVIEWPGSAIEALALSPDGKLIATAGRDKNRDIHLWDAATGKVVGVLKGHTEDVLTLAFS